MLCRADNEWSVITCVSKSPPDAMISGWANYFDLGQVSPVYKSVDRQATRRLRQWFWRKHKARVGRYARFSDKWLWDTHGLTRLVPKTRDLPWVKA